jgi:hypothetical protein
MSTDHDARSVGFSSHEDHQRFLLQSKDAEIEGLTAERDALRRAVQGLLMTDPAGQRADWPEYVAARAALKTAREA